MMLLKEKIVKRFELDDEDEKSLDIAIYVIESIMEELEENNYIFIDGLDKKRRFDWLNKHILKNTCELLYDIRCGVVDLVEDKE